MNHAALSMSSAVSELQKPTTYTIIREITNNDKGLERKVWNNRTEFAFRGFITPPWLHDLAHVGFRNRPPQFSNPVGLELRAQSTLGNIMKLPGRLCGTLAIGQKRGSLFFDNENEPQPNFREYVKYFMGDVQPFKYDAKQELRILSGYYQKSLGKPEKLNSREVMALFRLMIPLIPHFRDYSKGKLMELSQYRNGWLRKSDLENVVEVGACYVPEVIARMLKPNGFLDYTNAEDMKLLKDVDGFLCNLGNATALRHFNSIIWKTPLEMSKKILEPVSGDTTVYSRIANALGELAYRAGIDQDVSLEGFQQVLEAKLGIVHLMRTIGSMIGKMEGHERFKKFELAAADFQEAERLIERFKKLPAEKLGEDGEKLHTFLNDPELAMFMQAYKAKFPLAPDASNSVINTNPELDPLLCRAPESNKLSDCIEKSAAAR